MVTGFIVAVLGVQAGRIRLPRSHKSSVPAVQRVDNCRPTSSGDASGERCRSVGGGRLRGTVVGMAPAGTRPPTHAYMGVGATVDFSTSADWVAKPPRRSRKRYMEPGPTFGTTAKEDHGLRSVEHPAGQERHDRSHGRVASETSTFARAGANDGGRGMRCSRSAPCRHCRVRIALGPIAAPPRPFLGEPSTCVYDDHYWARHSVAARTMGSG